MSDASKENIEPHKSTESGSSVVIKPQSKPTCPMCGYVMTDDDMCNHEDDLFAIAANEEDADIECPDCAGRYVCRGGYTPNYISAIDPDDF